MNRGSSLSGQLPWQASAVRRTPVHCGVLFLILAPWSFEVVAQEFPLPKDQIQVGRSLYLKKCAQCHGKDASGGSAPDIQGMLLKDVKDSAQGVEAMPEIALSGIDARRVAVFLMSLAPDQARTRLGIK